MHRAALILSVALGGVLPAAAIEPEESGLVAAQLEAREKALVAETGAASPRALSPEARSALKEKVRAAREEILTSHGLDEKSWERGRIKLGKDGLVRMEAARKAEAARIAQSKEKKPDEAKPGAPQPVLIQRGFDDKRPVVVEEKPPSEGSVQIQRGTGQGLEASAPGGSALGTAVGDDGASPSETKEQGKPVLKGKGKREGGKRKSGSHGSESR